MFLKKKWHISIALCGILTGLIYFFGHGWLLHLSDYGPEPLIQEEIDHSFEGKVIIVGAGASGLASANLLERYNIDYEILEATNRAGGRIKKDETLADFPIDLGAEWIHYDPSILEMLTGKEASELNIKTIAYTPESYFWSDNKLSKTLNIFIALKHWSYPEYKFKDTTWYDFLDLYFIQNVEEKILYNSPVTQINYSGSQVKLTTSNGTVHTADKVILTVPIGVLQKKRITFEPPLNSSKTEAIESIEYLPGFKLFLKFTEKFYPESVEVDVDNGEYIYYDVAYGKDTKDNILGLLITGSEAQDYYQLGSQEAIVEAVIEEIDSISDGAGSTYFTGNYLYQDWGRRPFSLGTWSSSYEENLSTLVKPLDNKIYFAGEAYDLYGQRSTVHGAIRSGYQAVYDLLEVEIE